MSQIELWKAFGGLLIVSSIMFSCWSIGLAIKNTYGYFQELLAESKKASLSNCTFKGTVHLDSFDKPVTVTNCEFYNNEKVPKKN